MFYRISYLILIIFVIQLSSKYVLAESTEDPSLTVEPDTDKPSSSAEPPSTSGSATISTDSVTLTKLTTEKGGETTSSVETKDYSTNKGTDASTKEDRSTTASITTEKKSDTTASANITSMTKETKPPVYIKKIKKSLESHQIGLIVIGVFFGVLILALVALIILYRFRRPIRIAHMNSKYKITRF